MDFSKNPQERVACGFLIRYVNMSSHSMHSVKAKNEEIKRFQAKKRKTKNK